MGHIISENSNGVFPCFLLASGGFLAIFGIPCHVETSPWSLPSAERGLFLVCIWVPISPIYEDVRLDQGSTGSAGKESACNVGDLGSIPGFRRSPGEGKGYPLQYSCLENSMDYIVHWVAKSWTRLNNFHFHFIFTFYGICGDINECDFIIQNGK